ncbi:MAG: prepilin peptidase [Eubacteriales bacterium]
MDCILYGLLSIVLILSVCSDKKNYKIRNTYLVIGSTGGLIVNSINLGLVGFYKSILGFLFPMFCLMILFALHMIGAGDIKLFSTIGAIMGIRFIMLCMILSFVIGGIISLIILIFSKNLFVRIQYFINYFSKLIQTKKIVPYYDKEVDGYKVVIHFSYAIGIATTIQLVFEYYNISYL